MPLDPEIAALLPVLRSLPALEKMSPADARAVVNEMGKHAPPGPASPAVTDAFASTIPIRIYRPVDRPRGVIVFYHAGGWVLGDLNSSDAFLRTFALQTGCTIVSCGYRKAPEHRFPAAVDDAFTTLQWTAQSLATLASKGAPIFVAGESAGANLTAVVALLARDQGGPKLAGQVLLCPVTDANFDTRSYAENAEGYFLTRDLMKWFWNHYAPDEQQRQDFRASPLQANNHSNLPPALIQTAEYDPLRDEGEAYAKRLADSGTAVDMQRRTGLIHGYTGMLEASNAARAAIDAAAQWIRQRVSS
ncbi:alpha/beta hydrolase [Steroidobacter sp.]|uniref:alpha/beta hydrolase n=1 Tax=Steroidobacter sp. TaxID=1978227 RepID=UPI001A5D172B|nr:alpha/beta hydrolase [Steroidobacter sp.]MBL8268063.1 alpha/beta hydrolase [Steroidobacter sp.]